MSDDNNPERPQNGNQNSIQKRRSFMKTLGAGSIGSALFGGSIPSVGAVSNGGHNSSITTQDRAFDPIWYSPVENYWEGITRTDSTGEECEGAILIRGALTFNELREGDLDNLFSFNLFTFGISASEGIPESSLENETGPLEVMESTHTIRVESDDINVHDVTTNRPLIGAELGRDNTSVNSDLFKEIPDREDDWTTGEQDLKSADTDLPDDDESLMIGGASVALGVGTLVPGINLGVASLLTGTTVVLGLAGLVESMDDQGECESQTQDEWEYKAKETTDGFMNVDMDVSVFSHDLIIDIPVKHHNSATVDITDKIKHNDDGMAVPFQDDELPWMSDNETMEWTIDIPAYSPSENPENNTPSIIGGPENEP